MERLEDLDLFLRILDAGSISGAARALGLSPALASHRLKRLEASLGVRLLHRTTRQLHATAEGEQLADYGRSLLDELTTLTDDLRATGRGARGMLRLAAPNAFSRLYLGEVIDRFLADNPDVRVTLHASDRVSDLVREGFDIAVRIGQLPDSELISRTLATDQRLLCASPDYLERRGTPRRPEDLAEHHCLLLTSDARVETTWKLHRGRGPAQSVRVGGRFGSTSGDVLRQAALDGRGISQHSLWHVADDLRTGRLRRVLRSYRLPSAAIHAVMPHRRLVPARVRAFVTALTETFGTRAPWERKLPRNARDR